MRTGAERVSSWNLEDGGTSDLDVGADRERVKRR